MSNFPVDTLEEFKFRINTLQDCIDDDSPENAVPEMKSYSHYMIAMRHYEKGIYQKMLGQDDESIKSFENVIPLIQSGIGYSLMPKDNNEGLSSLFMMSLLLCNHEQSETSATKIINEATSIISTDSKKVFFVALAHLFLQKPLEALDFLPAIKKIESNKNLKFVKLGSVDTIKGICAQDEKLLAKGLTSMLDSHNHYVRYLRYPLSETEFISSPATMLCLIALRYGMDMKAKLKNSLSEVKTRPVFPIDRPELPSTKRFVVPVDYIPEYMLSPWREYWNIRK